ncbi:acyltransferase family protein [Terriglobus sp.]|uniref:acyltransferase family protein n=1 Tax=Terriglobus sp. TaxID=1889013 RepID=UPI003B00BC74
MQGKATLEVQRLSRPALPSVLPQPYLSRNLDLLRALAVVCVVASHLIDTLHLGRYGSLGRFGVILFFFHTSLVLVASLDRMHQIGSRWHIVTGFWVRRFFRIYPLSVLFVLAVWFLRLPPQPGSPYVPIRPAELVSNLLLIQNVTYQRDVQAPLWTLPLEAQMYVLLPFLFFAILRRRYISLAIWAATVPLAFWVPQITERLSVFRYAPCFAAGVVAFDLLRAKISSRLPGWCWPVVICVAAAAFGPWDNVSLPSKLARSFFCSAILAGSYPFLREIEPYRGQRIVQWVAEHSYGIYLSHGILLWLAFERVPHWSSWPIFVLSLILLPAVLYRYLERPLMLLGGHLSRRLLRHKASLRPTPVNS